MRAPPRHFAAGPAGPTIVPRDAAAALILLPDGRYVMQLRDDRPDIIYPGHWACFGGAVQPGETPLNALRRELAEELELRIGSATEFASFDYDLGPAKLGKFYRKYFELRLGDGEFEKLVPHEGSGMRAFAAQELLTTEWVTPHDAFAIWLHASRQRIALVSSPI